jgi:hypothetical protein
MTVTWSVTRWNQVWSRYLILVDNALLMGVDVAVAEDEAFVRVEKEARNELLPTIGTN